MFQPQECSMFSGSLLERSLGAEIEGIKLDPVKFFLLNAMLHQLHKVHEQKQKPKMLVTSKYSQGRNEGSISSSDFKKSNVVLTSNLVMISQSILLHPL